MKKCGELVPKIIVTIFVGIIMVAMIFCAWNCAHRIVCLSEIEIAGDVKNVFIMRCPSEADDVPHGTQAILYMGDKRIEDLSADSLCSLKYIYFLGHCNKISKSLYKTLVENNVCIVCKVGKLCIVDGNKSFFVKTSIKV